MSSPKDSTAESTNSPQPSPRPADDQTDKPWRTEGLTQESGDEDKPRRPRWLRIVLWFVLPYLVIFGLLTMQDQFTGAQVVSYTEFINQVEARNVSNVFSRGDTIQCNLKQPRPLPSDNR